MEISHLCKRIGKKNWDDLHSLWLNYLPQINFPLDNLPDPSSSLDNLKTIKVEIEKIEKESTNRVHYYRVDGLPQLAFQEAVILFYKALNVIKYSQWGLDGGFKTWSVADAYQSSYFALKCLLNLIGVHICRIESKDLLCDFQPDFNGLKRKEIISRRENFEWQIHLYKQFEHWEMWTLLQRMVYIFRSEIVDKKVLYFLARIEPKDFAKQRNKIIYFNSSWLFGDLKDYLFDKDFTIRLIDFDENIASDDDFSVIIAYSLIKICYILFKTLADSSRLFDQELQQINHLINDEKNHRYIEYSEKQLR